MAVQYPISILRDYAVNVRAAAARRKGLLAATTRDFLQNQGYIIGESLRIPGGNAFRATKAGQVVRVGIKTAADRWLNANRTGGDDWGVLSRVDEVFVTTMSPNYADGHRPTRVQVFAFDPRKIIEMAAAVEREKGRLDQNGNIFMPLDEHALGVHGRNVGASSGALIPHGSLVMEDEIEWLPADDEEAAPPPPDVDIPSPLFVRPRSAAPLGGLISGKIARAREDLARELGVAVDAVRIEVTLT